MQEIGSLAVKRNANKSVGHGEKEPQLWRWRASEKEPLKTFLGVYFLFTNGRAQRGQIEDNKGFFSFCFFSRTKRFPQKISVAYSIAKSIYEGQSVQLSKNGAILCAPV